MNNQNSTTQNSSVYLSLKPVIIVCKILGSCCIQNTSATEARLVHHRYLSFTFLYSVLFHFGISYMMHATIELRRQKLAVTWFYDIRKWCFLFAVFVTERQRVQVIKELDEFDKSISQLNKTSLIVSNNRFRGHIWLFVYKLIYGIGTDLVSYTLFYPKGKTVVALILDLAVKTFTAQLVFCYTVLYLAFAYELCHRFRLITVSWRHHAKAFADFPTETVQSFESLRLFHGKLCAIAEKLASCYGLFFVVNLFFVFLEMLMYLYRMVHISKNVFSNVQSIVFLAANVASLPALSIASSYITDASKCILNELHLMTFADFPYGCETQIILFNKQIASDPLQISACGFFLVNRELISATLMAMMTYMIVIIQLGSQFERLSSHLFY